jgi:hypothetical protein
VIGGMSVSANALRTCEAKRFFDSAHGLRKRNRAASAGYESSQQQWCADCSCERKDRRLNAPGATPEDLARTVRRRVSLTSRKQPPPLRGILLSTGSGMAPYALIGASWKEWPAPIAAQLTESVGASGTGDGGVDAPGVKLQPICVAPLPQAPMSVAVPEV